MFYQHGHKSFQGTKRRAVDHYRAMLFVIGTSILQFETVRQIIIYLNGSQLPFTSQRIAYHKVQFRTVERRFAEFGYRWQVFLMRSFYNGAFGFFPQVVGANVFAFILRVTKRDLGGIVIKTQGIENVKYQVNYFGEFFFNLVRPAENVRIILGKAAYAGQTMKFAALLVTVNGTEFR